MISMHRHRSLVVLAVVALQISSAAAAPFVPRSDDEVLELLPVSFRPEMTLLRELRAEFQRSPDDLALALRIAWQYIELGRRSGDPRYHGWAEGAAQPWLSHPHPPGEVLVLRATLRQNRHEFDDALEDLSRVLARNPRNAGAWFTRSTILQVQGRHAAAQQSCRPLLRLGERLAAASCLARVGAASGRAAESFDMLRAVLASHTASPAMRQFALTSLAEIAAQIGRGSEAERYFNQALAIATPDPYAIAAWADFLLDRGRAQDVVELITAEARADGLVLRRVLAGLQLGDPSIAASGRALEARYAAAHRRGQALHLGEESRFVLHVLGDPQKALELALENFVIQREPRDLRAVLEAAVAARDPQAAAPGLAFLRRSGLEDEQLQRLVRQIRGL